MSELCACLLALSSWFTACLLYCLL